MRQNDEFIVTFAKKSGLGTIPYFYIPINPLKCTVHLAYYRESYLFLKKPYC